MQKEISSIITPNENDVLAGRGCGSQLHPGNVKFRNIVKNKKEQYVLLKGNKQKNKLAFQVYQEILSMDPPGRFLSKSSCGNWILQDEKAIMVKVKQALRERSAPRPKSPIHGTKVITHLDTNDMATNHLLFSNHQNSVGHVLGSSFVVTKHYSDFRSFLISDSAYIMSFASDHDHLDFIKRFLAGVYDSLTWDDFERISNYHYDERDVGAFLNALWQLYPFLGKAYCIDSGVVDSSRLEMIRIKRTGDFGNER